MSNDESDVDRLLHDAAVRWRASQRHNISIDAARFEGVAASSAPSRGFAAAAIGLFVVAALIATTVALAPGPSPLGAIPTPPAPTSTQSAARPTSVIDTAPTDSPPPQNISAEPSAFQPVADGDRVGGFGQLIEGSAGTVRLCPQLVELISGGAVACAETTAVNVSGLDLHALAGERRGTDWVSAYVRVLGTWSHGTVQAESATFAQSRPEADLTVPCSAPPGGWLSSPQSSAQEQAQAQLEDEVNRHTDRYGGVWVGQIDTTSERAVVVGTVGDVVADQQELSKIYPFNLCVTAVSFSANALNQVTSKLEAAARPWQVFPDPVTDRVRVSMASLDTVSADDLTPYADTVLLQTTVVAVP